MKYWEHKKRYIIKEISEDGLLKDPRDSWGNCVFEESGYGSEKDAWKAVEQYAGDANGKYAWRVSFVVMEKWVLQVTEDI